MNNTDSMEQKVTAAFTDRRCEMDIFHASQLFQDAFTEFFAQYGCDAIRMSKSHGAVWAIARSKIRYERLPLWGQTVRVRALARPLATARRTVMPLMSKVASRQPHRPRTSRKASASGFLPVMR